MEDDPDHRPPKGAQDTPSSIDGNPDASSTLAETSPPREPLRLEPPNIPGPPEATSVPKSGSSEILALPSSSPSTPPLDISLPGTVPVQTASRVRFTSATRSLSSSGPRTPASGSRPLRPDGSFPQPRKIGRYIVLRELGQGGMGVTYIAYDESLHREVVIKLVRPDDVDPEKAQRRLRREAQAMAQLSHPNTVAVYEVGTHDEQVFIAMERIIGRSLSAWLEQSPDDWLQILDIMRQAGAGLAAAHDAQLVHRDFKPANVMLGDDGRVRVLDFGMARMSHDPDLAAEQSLSGSQSGSFATLSIEDDESEIKEDLTVTGSFVGTPMYASPEQFRGLIADAKSDQFSYCVTLYRALYGRRPFRSKKLGSLAKEVVAGRFRAPPSETKVPRWLWPVLERGLDPNPNRRWPSMHALLDALSKNPQTNRRHWVTATMIAVGVTSAFIAGSRLLPRSPAAKLCKGAATQLDGTWDEDKRLAIERAMLASGVPRALDIYNRTRTALNSYAQQWTTTYESSCQMFLEQGHTEILAKSVQCMNERRQSLTALVDALIHVDAETMRKAAPAASSLPRISVCSDVEYLKAQVKPPDDPVIVARVDDIRGLLLRATEMEHIGRIDSALQFMESAMVRVADVDYDPLTAEALVLKGHLQTVTGQYPEAEATLRQAYVTARKAGISALAGEAATHMAYLVGYKQARPKDGRLWVQMAALELAQHGTDEALALLERRRAAVAMAEGDAAKATIACRASLDILMRTLDPQHPEITSARQNLGVALLQQGIYDEAERELSRASLAWRTSFGSGNSRLAMYALPHAFALSKLGRHDEAVASARHHIRQYEQHFGTEHPDLVRFRLILARSLMRIEAYEEAILLLDRAIDHGQKTLSSDHPWVTELMAVRARASHRSGRRSVAQEAYEKILRQTEDNDPSTPHLEALLGLAEIHFANKDFKPAHQLALRAMLIRQEHPRWPEEVARAGFLLARTMTALDLDRNEAIAFAEQALEDYRAIAGTANRAAIETIEAWLGAQKKK